MCQKKICIVIGLSAIVVASGIWQGAAKGERQREAAVAVKQILADRVEVEFSPPGGRAGMLEAELYTVEGTLLAKVTQRHKGREVTAALYAQIDKDNPGNYYLRYRFDKNEKWIQRSLLFTGTALEVTVLGQREFVAGTSPVIRVLVEDRSSGTPGADAAVTVELRQGDDLIGKVSVKTNSRGEAAIPLNLPDGAIENAKLKITVRYQKEQKTVEETVQIRSAMKTLLTTDKPMYQPGQTIHIRALTLSESTMKAASGAEAIFEVEDARGNKVFKAGGKTDEYGISHVDFVLADELNKGTWRVRAIVAGSREEKTVTVERYVLPKFKVNVKTDRSFYQPGETVQGDIQVDYFFGKPTAGGKVEIHCAKFDVAYEDFQVIEGKTDESGHYHFEAKLPGHFVGQPFEAGKASAKFEVKVTDTADHAETVTKNVSVTASPIVIAAVAEGGELIADLKNRVYIVTTYADGTPAKCSMNWKTAEHGSGEIETDEGGFGQLELTPESDKAIEMQLEAKDSQGHAGRGKVTLQTKAQEGDDTILLRTERSLYRVGDKVKLSMMSTRKSGTAYIDVIKDRQTCLTRTVELKDGSAEDTFTLEAGLAGTVQINVWLIGRNGVMTRDQRIVLAEAADELRIKINSDEETYLPGGEAKLKFTVTNNKGSGVASALGVMVVDEAVFALQEMQPGLEKVYFYLEKEIATPRYEIHGYDLDRCIAPLPGEPGEIVPMEQQGRRRDEAAKTLLASAKGVGDYTLRVNTMQDDPSLNRFRQETAGQLMKPYEKIRKALNRVVKKKEADEAFREKSDLAWLVKKGYLSEADTIDPWGQVMKIKVNWVKAGDQYVYRGFILSSAGIDGIWDTLDEVTMPMMLGQPNNVRLFMKGGRMVGGDLMMAREEAPAAAMAPAPMEVRTKVAADQSSTAGGSQTEPVRVREYFPETLYFNPALITDGAGRVDLSIPLADSITTWRLTCLGNSTAGLLGSTTAGLRVFQEFFVDIDFPVSLTQNDAVHVPVAIYNYLKTEQKIVLTVTKGDWFEMSEPAEKTVTLGPDEVRAVYFPIVAKKVGFQKFTVTARGSKRSDAVARTVEIRPDGQEHVVNHSGRLDRDVTHTIAIPDPAIEGASAMFVKVYPGVLSQVAEGLDGMLRMPFGCFEQTSSVTYPNVLVMDYMKTTGKITPELQMKAEEFINTGYQRLVSYEVPGGGFEWFGKAPANRILTAYGLMEFYDMSKVHEVDPAIISRTQQWLAGGQEKDGSYKPSEGGIREGAINKFTDDVLRVTAYITWALASTEYKGEQVGRGVDYIKAHGDGAKDVYTLAMIANALGTVDPKDKTTLDVLRKLHEKRVEKDDVVYWQLDSETPTHGTGQAGDIEVTALAAQAFLRCGQELGTVSKAITCLVKSKDAFGTWQSTQATIQALRAMLMAERGATARTKAKIDVVCNDEKVKTLTIDENNSDVLQLVDLKSHIRAGDNTVSLKFEGEGALLYQMVGRYYLPRAGVMPAMQEPMTITLAYDKTTLATNDTIGVTATVKNNRPATAKMVIVDLGLPPGFTLLTDKLEKLVADQTIEKYSVTGRQIIVYLREIAPDKPVTITYQLLAKYPLKAQTTPSAAYEYYNPDVRAEAAPIQLTVETK